MIFYSLSHTQVRSYPIQTSKHSQSSSPSSILSVPEPYQAVSLNIVSPLPCSLASGTPGGRMLDFLTESGPFLPLFFSLFLLHHLVRDLYLSEILFSILKSLLPDSSTKFRIFLTMFSFSDAKIFTQFI